MKPSASERISSSSRRPHHDPAAFSKAFPFLLKYLKRNDVLNLRPVCESWAQAVDDYIGEASQYFLQHLDCELYEMKPIWNQSEENTFPYEIGGDAGLGKKLNQFLDSMMDHPRNPFVGQSMVIRGNRKNDRRELLAQTSKLLPAFGHHLKYLNLDLEGVICSRYEMTALIRGVLLDTPNLKQLRLALNPQFENEAERSSPRLQEIRLYQLRVLQLDFIHSGYNNEFPFFNDLVRIHSHQLEKLQVERMGLPGWHILNWWNLREFRGAVGDPRWTMGQLPIFLQMQAPLLKKLTLDCGGRPHSLQELLEVMRHFPKLRPAGMKVF